MCVCVCVCVYIFQHFLPVIGFPFDFLTLSFSKLKFSHLMKSSSSFFILTKISSLIFMISAFYVLNNLC